MTALPFDLPTLSRGFAELSPAARELGRGAADAAARALTSVLGVEVAVHGEALPGSCLERAAASARVAIALDGVPATALLEVDAAVAAAALAAVAGEDAPIPVALRATPVEQSLLELLALVALEACVASPLGRLAPRMVEGAAPPRSGLAVALRFAVGAHRGGGRLLVPPAALRLLAGERELSPAAAALAVGASYRDGEATLSADEVVALEPGDAVLVASAPPTLVFPGGLSLRGVVDEAGFSVEEIRMTESQASWPITVAVEVGRVTLTLGELSRIEPGGALPLDLRRDGRAVLRAGERALAHGHLVEIDGALAVRIDGLGERP